ncbi:uncharacterized protein LOC128681224 isoform X1 [Plodia interpunctella]|uniref:uncharacterized protein LOC128681224 isoform X1 n=1 Tax=Plodia interpunctella TaxID=58824 RepID=UPI0023680965|nr:uncharacterized protein LOC128681224 isoform X1 [Plodia interpunctella]
MLVLRFLWSYGFLIIFMAHPLSTAPTNGSLPITIKLKEEIATRYGKLLKALISVNEQRLDVLHKLHRLQDLPLGVLRTQEPEVYAVWKLDTKPTLLEELLQERNHLIEAYTKNLAAAKKEKPKAKEKQNTKQKPGSDESSSSSKEILDTDEKEDKEINKAPINKGINDGTTTEKTSEESSLEFWKGSQEVLSSDDEKDEVLNSTNEITEAVEKNLIIIPYLSPLTNSLEFFEASQEVTAKKDFRRYKYAQDCSRKASKYCQIACNEAFKKMCGRFKCTSQVKRNYKKQCHFVCLEEFVTDSEYFKC